MASHRGLTRGTPEYSRALNKRGSASGSIAITEQSVTFRVNAWKYTLRADVKPSPFVADAAYALAKVTVAGKERFVTEAIRQIRNGSDPEDAFLQATESAKAVRRSGR